MDFKSAIESVLALLIVENMSRSSVRHRSPKKACLYITDIETKFGLEIQKLVHAFSFHFYQMLISVS